MKLRYCLVMFLCLYCGMVFAADPAPLTMLKQTSDQMLSMLRQYKGQLKPNDRRIYDIVNKILLPHFNLDEMSRAVVGPRYWQPASVDTREQFQKAFTHYVTRTYSTALAGYRDETIRFFPLRGAVSGDRIVVHSQIVQRDGPSIAVDYRLMRMGGEWKVYDFSVDNVSLVQNYRAQFANVLAQGGLSKLVQELQVRGQGQSQS